MNIIFMHCSALIIIGNFKLKMSRSYGSYDADWQRRKSLLIRSLFHDIPILSPVEEESDDSSQQYYVPTQEVFPSPPRPYSPLPPLIIEKVPIANKHDEPEEYYNKLYKKIKIIYKKLFIEKRNFSSIDYGSNYSDSSVSDDSDGSDQNLDFRYLESNSPDNGNFDSIIEDREARRSSVSTKSNGYGADFESMDTAIIDVVNVSNIPASNEDGIMISHEEESDSENIYGDVIRNEDSDSSKSSDNKESRRERIDDPELSGEEESHHYINNDHEMIEEEDSNQPEDEQSYEKESSDIEDIEEHKIPEETSQASSIDDDEETENEIEYELQPNNLIQSKHDSFDKERKSKEFGKTVTEYRKKIIESNVEPMERDVETTDSSEGPTYRQITTAAMIHFDGSSDAGERESRVYEDSIKSVILPTKYRRAVVSRKFDVYDRIEVLTVLDDNADPKTTPSFYTDESENTEEDFEEMATPQPKAKEGSIIETRTPHAYAPEENDEEMSALQPKATQENVEEIGTPRLDSPEEMTTSQPDPIEKDVEGSGRPRPAARDEETEEMEFPPPEATGEDVEEMGPPLLDAPEEDDEEIATPQPQFADEDVEGMGSHEPAARDEETEEMGIPLPEFTEEDVKEMGTPRLDSYEEDDEEMTTPQESGEEDVEGIESPEPEIKATEVDVDEMGSPHTIEQMRTPRPDLSHGTIPTTHRSHSESTSEHSAVQQEQTAQTSSTQDGAGNSMSELQTSNDINEILTSILNDTRNKDGTPISGRKRKYVDKSVQAVQTSRVTWDEMRANFFVGTPKIFRLCACADHICY